MKTSVMEPRVVPLGRKDRPNGRGFRAASDDAGQDLLEVLLSLPENQRLAFMLRRFHRLEYGEIAARLEISERTARNNVYHVFRELQRHFVGNRESGITSRTPPDDALWLYRP